MKDRKKQRENRKKYCRGQVTDLRNSHGYFDPTSYNATLSIHQEKKSKPMPSLIRSVLIVNAHK